MNKTDHTQRVLAKRRHRTLGLFIAHKAQCYNLEAVLLSHSFMCRYLEITRIEKARINQLKEDLMPWNNHITLMETSFSARGLHHIVVSNIDVGPTLDWGDPTTLYEFRSAEGVIKSSRSGGLAIEDIEKLLDDIYWLKNKILTEEDVVKYLSLLSSGLIEPSSKDLSIRKSKKRKGSD